MPGKGKGRKSKKSKARSRSSRAGLIFPVARVGRYMRSSRGARRLGSGGPVFMASVLQYLCAEILELAGEAFHERKKKTISPRHLQLAVRGDDELNKLMACKQISTGGTMSIVQTELFPKNKV